MMLGLQARRPREPDYDTDKLLARPANRRRIKEQWLDMSNSRYINLFVLL